MFGERRFRPSVVDPAAALWLWFATVIAVPAQPQSASRDPCAPLSAGPPGIHAPADFAGMVDGTMERLQIRPSGEATSWIGDFRGASRHSPMRYEVEHRRTLSPSARDRIRAQVLACRFFDLDRSHVNRSIRDGWGMSVTIAAGGRSHTVGAHMVSLPRLDTIRRCRPGRAEVSTTPSTKWRGRTVLPMLFILRAAVSASAAEVLNVVFPEGGPYSDFGPCNLTATGRFSPEGVGRVAVRARWTSPVKMFPWQRAGRTTSAPWFACRAGRENADGHEPGKPGRRIRSLEQPRGVVDQPDGWARVHGRTDARRGDFSVWIGSVCNGGYGNVSRVGERFWVSVEVTPA